MVGWEAYETWDEATVGQSGPALRTFEITEEDILDYNRACGETDPLMIDPGFARQHSPTGELLQHPIFVTTIAFYCLGREGNRHWIWTPAPAIHSNASRSSSRSAMAKSSPSTVTTADKFTQRGKPYLQMVLDFRNERAVLKARWWCSLILPETRADVARFANA